MGRTETIQGIQDSYDNYIFKFGRKTAVGTTPLIIYSGATPYTGWLSPENNVIAVSTSTEDEAGENGATAITVVGQGDDGLEITEDITLTGQVPTAPTTVKFAIIYRMFVKTTEDVNPVTGPNHGSISVYEAGTPTNICAIIDAEVLGTTIAAGQTTMCIYRIPSNKYGEILDLGIFVDEGKSGTIVTKVRETQTGPWLTKATFSIFQGSIVQRRIKPEFILPGSDVILIASSSAAGTTIDGNFELELKDLPEAF